MLQSSTQFLDIVLHIALISGVALLAVLAVGGVVMFYERVQIDR